GIQTEIIIVSSKMIKLNDEREIFLGYDISKRKNMADATALRVDTEIHTIIMDAYAKTKQLLKKYRSELDILAQGLVEYETLSGDEIQDLLKGKKIRVSEQKTEIPPRKTVPDSVDNIEQKKENPPKQTVEKRKKIKKEK
ncbi:MAG: hypothetical protein J6V11_00665, partial [Alphaproteobacteria bacterium]|nr:hypothetical protein [Alphaproteobacteria bacterium]